MKNKIKSLPKSIQSKILIIDINGFHFARLICSQKKLRALSSLSIKKSHHIKDKLESSFILISRTFFLKKERRRTLKL